MNTEHSDGMVMPLVGIIMGSESDLPVMREAVSVLTEFHVPYEIKVVSAHRTPARLYEYAQSAEERGLEVLIAGAGGAAHLPGMAASLTHLPVIGVPVRSRELDGIDSVLSIVQMPGGVPVAAVGINNARNAALLAVRMLSIKYPELMKRYRAHVARMRDGVAYHLEDRIAKEVS